MSEIERATVMAWRGADGTTRLVLPYDTRAAGGQFGRFAHASLDRSEPPAVMWMMPCVIGPLRAPPW